MGKGIQGGWDFPYTIPDSAPFALVRGLLHSNDAGVNCTITVRVQPRASRNRVDGYREGALRVSVTAPPHGGRANAALLELLANALGVAKSRLTIIRGHSSRDKIVAVVGLAEEDINRLLEPTALPPTA